MFARAATASLILAAAIAGAEASPRSVGRLDTAQIRIAQPVRPGTAMIVNQGSRPLWVLQVTPVDAPAWGGDRLGSGSLQPGGKGLLRLGSTTQCLYDLRGSFANGREVTRFGLDLCNTPEVVLSDEDTTTALPEARPGLVLFRVTNRTGAPVVALHVSASEGQERGDTLGAWVMEEGMHYTGRAAATSSCLFDLKSVYSLRERDHAVMGGQNLCENRELVLPRRGAMGALRP